MVKRLNLPITPESGEHVTVNPVVQTDHMQGAIDPQKMYSIDFTPSTPGTPHLQPITVQLVGPSKLTVKPFVSLLATQLTV